MTRALRWVSLACCGAALIGAGGCNEHPMSRLHETNADLFGLESRLASDPTACVDYLALCEQAESLCLMVDRTADSVAVCDAIVARCQTNLDTYCGQLPADGAPAADANDGGPATEPQPSCGDGVCDATEGCGGCPADCGACQPQRATVAPVADAYVDQADSASSFGQATRLRTDQGPDQRALLRFVVPDLGGAVQAATLRLYVTNASADGPVIHLADTGWSEADVTWSSQPALGEAVVDLGRVSSGWLEIDLKQAVVGPGELAFALVPTSSDGADFASRESSNPPQLVVTTIGAGTPSEPAPSDPGPSDPGPSDPGPSDPGPSDPGPSDPGPSDPGPSDPGPSQPSAPSQPGAALDSQYLGQPKWCKVAVHTHPDKTSGQTLASAYAAAGFDLVFFTDHDYDTQTAPVAGVGIVTVRGEEVSTDSGHCNALGISSFIKPKMSHQETIDAVAAQGGLLQINHPSRYSALSKSVLDKLNGLWGIEILNASQHDPDDIVLWDSQISQGKRLWGTFSDDAHSTGAVGRGWLMVNTASDCSKAPVLASMKVGSFYGSEGPMLTITVTGGTISVTSPTASKLEWYKQSMTKLKTTQGTSDTYTIDGSEVFVRVVATDASGKLAMSQPIFRKP